MFRVYKQFLQHLLVICLHHRDRGESYRDDHEYVWSTWYRRLGRHKTTSSSGEHEPTQIRQLLEFMEAGSYKYDQHQLDHIITQLLKQLSSPETLGSGDRDLIDTIVRILGLPHARNTLGGGVLSSLKDAILIPEEIVGLRQLVEQECYCASCGHKFLHGEMATFVKPDGDRHSKSFSCTRCLKPSYLAADNDHAKSIAIDQVKGLKSALLKKQLSDSSTPAEQPQVGNRFVLPEQAVYAVGNEAQRQLEEIDAIRMDNEQHAAAANNPEPPRYQVPVNWADQAVLQQQQDMYRWNALAPPDPPVDPNREAYNELVRNMNRRPR